MKSDKPLRDIQDIVLPYRFTPDIDIQGSVNSKSFFFPKGKEAELTKEQYETIAQSSYAGQLKN